jgi:hypothetical protein
MKYTFTGNTDYKAGLLLLGGEWRGMKMARVFHEQRLSIACEDRR